MRDLIRQLLDDEFGLMVVAVAVGAFIGCVGACLVIITLSLFPY